MGIVKSWPKGCIQKSGIRKSYPGTQKTDSQRSHRNRGGVHSSKLAVLCGHRIDEVWLMARFNVRRVIKAVDLCVRCHLRHDLRTPITTAPATLNFHLFNPWLSAHKIEPSLSAALSPSQMLLLRHVDAELWFVFVDWPAGRKGRYQTFGEMRFSPRLPTNYS